METRKEMTWDGRGRDCSDNSCTLRNNKGAQNNMDNLEGIILSKSDKDKNPMI